jgi:asparagine synthase (glutamine-hydrolysing)
MFAFAVWDERNERLFLARDRIGIKPLYYGIYDSWFIFASEIKAILEHPEARSTIELNAIPEYLLCTSLLDSRTMFENIRSVAPGTTLVVDGGTVKEHRYWSMEHASRPYDGGSFDECKATLRELLESSIRLQVVSDVPFGTLLSGGLDSSLVTAMAARSIDGPLRTFSMDYDKNRSLRSEGTDTHYAHLVSAAYRTAHTELLFQPQDYLDVLTTVSWYVEKPVDLTSPSLYLLYRGVKPTVTVVTSGEGADELFAGYDFFLDRWRARQPEEFPWAPHLDEISTLLDPGLEAETAYRERIHSTLAVEMNALDTPDLLNKELFLFLKYYMVEMLERLDKTSMAWAVESRVPFLDHRVVEYVLNLPSSFKSTGASDKILLKSIAADLLPSEVIRRKKRPVPIPVDPKTLFSQRNEANALVQSASSRIGNYFDKRKVDAFFRKKDGFAATDNLALYRTSHAVIALDAWHRAFGVTS